LQSANDAAVALAIAADGSIEAFAERMNRTAERLGLTDTHFTNPHGLHDDAHYTTAYDLACITAKAMEHPFLRNVFKTKSYRADRETESRIFTNHNKLLNESIHAVGVKTGYTRAAGRCLVGAADIDGMSLISVTLNAPNDWNDHLSLWQYATDSYEVREILSARGFLQNIPIAGGFLPYLSASNREGFSALLPKNAAPAKVYAEYTPILFAPIRQNDVVGSIVIEQDGKVLKRLPLCADLDVPGLNFN
jgi:D-alanyl-D-alanine carboxypeptidase/D-alanyl-D-alanine carboxypeptidase (penicillin-binding protein 5/6)